jgi:hypothetical protein
LVVTLMLIVMAPSWELLPSRQRKKKEKETAGAAARKILNDPARAEPRGWR